MASSFEVQGAFALGDRGLFALTGEISAGTVLTGMRASRSGEDVVSFNERVHGVEFLDLPGAQGKPSLTFHYRDPAKLARWMALDWEGKTLSLSF